MNQPRSSILNRPLKPVSRINEECKVSQDELAARVIERKRQNFQQLEHTMKVTHWPKEVSPEHRISVTRDLQKAQQSLIELKTQTRELDRSREAQAFRTQQQHDARVAENEKAERIRQRNAAYQVAQENKRLMEERRPNQAEERRANIAKEKAEVALLASIPGSFR